MKLSPRDQDVILARFGRRIGWRIPTWVQGAGGNVSLKTERNGRPTLLVKASGMRLDQMTPDRGISVVDTEAFHSRFDLSQKADPKSPSSGAEIQYADALANSVVAQGSGSAKGRPSMETGLHVALAAPLVAHFHSLPAILMGHHMAQDKRLKTWIEHETNAEVVFLPPIMPGRDLALETYAHRHAKIFIVANHGVILALQHMADISHWEKIERAFLKKHEYLDVLAEWSTGHRENLAEKVRKNPIPLKFFMPDVAVFADEIQKSLVVSTGEDGEKLYTLHSAKRDLMELWSAQQILFVACPQLASLPHSLVTRIRKLPTEEYRLTKSAS